MVDYMTVINYIVDVLLWLSILAALLTLLTFSLFSELRTYPIKLIMYLCGTIVGAFAAIFFGNKDFIYGSWLCWPTAIVTHYFFLANFGWCFAVAFNFYQMIVRRNRESESFEKIYHGIAWGVPLLIVIIVGATKKYGRITPQNCYIIGALPAFFSFLVPCLIVVVCNCVLFFFVSREIRSTLAAAPKTDNRTFSKEFKVYVSIFVSIGLTWFFAFLVLLVPNRKAQNVLVVFFLLTTPLQGLLIFAAYCINAKVAAKWAGLFGKCPGFGPACQRMEAAISASNTYSRF